MRVKEKKGEARVEKKGGHRIHILVNIVKAADLQAREERLIIGALRSAIEGRRKLRLRNAEKS